MNSKIIAFYIFISWLYLISFLQYLWRKQYDSEFLKKKCIYCLFHFYTIKCVSKNTTFNSLTSYVYLQWYLRKIKKKYVWQTYRQTWYFTYEYIECNYELGKSRLIEILTKWGVDTQGNVCFSNLSVLFPNMPCSHPIQVSLCLLHALFHQIY